MSPSHAPTIQSRPFSHFARAATFCAVSPAAGIALATLLTWLGAPELGAVPLYFGVMAIPLGVFCWLPSFRLALLGLLTVMLVTAVATFGSLFLVGDEDRVFATAAAAAMSVIALGALIAPTLVVVRVFRRVEFRHETDLCWSCRYPLAGLDPKSACPECGSKRLDSSMLAHPAPRLAHGRRDAQRQPARDTP